MTSDKQDYGMCSSLQFFIYSKRNCSLFVILENHFSLSSAGLVLTFRRVILVHSYSRFPLTWRGKFILNQLLGLQPGKLVHSIMPENISLFLLSVMLVILVDKTLRKYWNKRLNKEHLLITLETWINNKVIENTVVRYGNEYDSNASPCDPLCSARSYEQTFFTDRMKESMFKH